MDQVCEYFHGQGGGHLIQELGVTVISSCFLPSVYGSTVLTTPTCARGSNSNTMLVLLHSTSIALPF